MDDDLTAASHARSSRSMTWAAMILLEGMVFLVALAYSAGLPLLRPTLIRHLGQASPAEVSRHVGLLAAAYLGGLFTFAPLWGRLSDRHGRTWVLTGGYAGFVVGGALAALAPSLAFVYGGRLLAGMGAAAVMPTAQAYIADLSTSTDRNQRFVLLGGASFLGFVAGPAFGTWLAGPVMGMPVGRMASMLAWPALMVAAIGLLMVLLAPVVLDPARSAAVAASALPAGLGATRRRFVWASMLLAGLAAFAVGAFELGFNLFGSQTLGLSSGAMAAMFITCSLAMLAAQSVLLLSAVRRLLDQYWVAAAFAGAAVALTFTSFIPGAGALGLLIAVVGTAAGMVGPVLSYELLERCASRPGTMLGQQAAAGNLGQAIGSTVAGFLFTVDAMAPFWTAAIVLICGSMTSLAWWGPARNAEIHDLDARIGTASAAGGDG